jgi:hypothetical protein
MVRVSYGLTSFQTTELNPVQTVRRKWRIQDIRPLIIIIFLLFRTLEFSYVISLCYSYHVDLVFIGTMRHNGLILHIQSNFFLRFLMWGVKKQGFDGYTLQEQAPSLYLGS